MSRLIASLVVAATVFVGVGCRREEAPGAGATPEPDVSPPTQAPPEPPARSATPPAEPRPARALALGGWHSCAIVDDDGADDGDDMAIVCWGGADLHQLGATNDASVCSEAGYVGPCTGTPQPVAEAAGRPALLAAGTATSCAVFEGTPASLHCWGAGPIAVATDTRCPRLPEPVPCSSEPVRVEALPDAISVSIGGGHGCAVAGDDGRVSCWGSNGEGQLGTDAVEHSVEPVTVDGLSGISSVALGDRHGCALGRTGDTSTLWCWGSNLRGQLGDGTTSSRAKPALVDGLPEPIAAVAAGGAHTCAVSDGGRVWCWGSNSRGQIGDDTFVDRSAPVEIDFAQPVREIAAGLEHTCARLDDGSARCWGANDLGQLGDDSRDDRGRPTPVAALGAATAIAAGANHTCAITGAGALVSCWGDNRARQLGRTGMADAQRPGPVTW